jgi:hypothetical protein
MGAGSGSDGEATAGEMSDGAVAKRKKLKLVSHSARGTPSASRAGSPNPQGGKSLDCQLSNEKHLTFYFSHFSRISWGVNRRTIRDSGQDSERGYCHRRTHQSLQPSLGRSTGPDAQERMDSVGQETLRLRARQTTSSQDVNDEILWCVNMFLMVFPDASVEASYMDVGMRLWIDFTHPTYQLQRAKPSYKMLRKGYIIRIFVSNVAHLFVHLP